MGISCSKQQPFPTKVVVIGGSYAGRGIVKLLDPIFDVVWIERRPGLIHKMMARTAVDDKWIEPVLIPSDKMLERGSLLHGNVTAVDMTKKEVSVETRDGPQTITYDFLVIASGGTSVAPVEPPFKSLAESGTRDSVFEYFNNVTSTIAKHKNILIVGGGPVGCELAGEIKAKYPGTRVTIAHKGDSLCSGMNLSQEGSDKIKTALVNFGIEVLVKQDINLTQEEKKRGLTEHETPKRFSDAIEDITLVINSTGFVPNTEFLPSDILTESKCVKVNQFLQVNDSVFAIGDCNNAPGPKLFALAGTKKFMFVFPTGQADIAAANLIALQTQKPLTAYDGLAHTKKPRAMIPIGSKGGVSVNAPGFLAKLKAKDYFYPAQWKFSGYSQAPKIKA